RAGQALRVCNAYQRSRSKAALIVTCRTAQYQALTAEHTWVQDAARIEIRPVNAKQARAFIASRAVDPGRWQPVLDGMRDRRGHLAAAFSTPWRLTLVTTVYEHRDLAGRFLHGPERLTRPDLDTPDAVRDHLLGQFIPAALQVMPKVPYKPDRVHQWLAVLA